MKVLKDVSYGEKERNTLDVMMPDGKVEAFFVYIHGGGLNSSTKYVPTPEIFNMNNIAVVALNYTMYPSEKYPERRAKYPEFIDDCAKGVRWAYDYMLENTDCKKFFVGGSSAGGYISMMLCFDRRYLEKYGMSNDMISGYVHDAGQPTTHFRVLMEEDKMDNRRIVVDERAPLYYVGVEKEYPPMKIIVSDDDMQNRYEQTVLLASTLRHFGYKDYDIQIMRGNHCKYFDKERNFLLGNIVVGFIKQNLLRVNQKDL